jgi:hypothetical protein
MSGTHDVNGKLANLNAGLVERCAPLARQYQLIKEQLTVTHSNLRAGQAKIK